MPSLRRICRTADDFSLAGVNPDTRFPIGFVSVKDVADTIDEFGNDHMKETLKRADFERVASSLAESEQCIERYELADGISFNAELEVENIDRRPGQAGPRGYLRYEKRGSRACRAWLGSRIRCGKQ